MQLKYKYQRFQAEAARAVTPKVFLIPADELEEHLQDAQELVRRGNNIIVKK